MTESLAAWRTKSLAGHTPTVGPLELGLAWLELVFDERTRSPLDLKLGGCQSQVHGAQDAARGHPLADPVAGRGTPRWRPRPGYRSRCCYGARSP